MTSVARRFMDEVRFIHAGRVLHTQRARDVRQHPSWTQSVLSCDEWFDLFGKSISHFYRRALCRVVGYYHAL